MKLNDEEIVNLLTAPQTVEKGLRAMMDIYQSRLYWHIRRLIVDHDQAQDVLQDTFIKAYQNIHQFKSDSKLYTWLYRIATNEALQQLNKMNRMKKTDEDAEYYMQNLVADTVGKDGEEIQVLLQQGFNLELHVFGVGDYRLAGYDRYIKHLGLQSNVFFRGHQENMKQSINEEEIDFYTTYEKGDIILYTNGYKYKIY